MAQREELRLDVKVKGADDVDKLADSLEDVESAGDKARAALKDVAQSFDTELRSATATAEALGDALGPELTSRLNVDDVVLDLNKMGVSFDEIRADADLFATTLKEVDGIRLQQVSDGLGDTATKMRAARTDANNMGRSADSSRNALANMIGNSAQDVSGLSSSLGVAIGQLAEFGADARLSGEGLGSVAKNTLKVVPAVAGLALAGTAVSTAMQGMADQTAFNTEQVNKFTEALKEGKSVAEALADEIRDTGKVEFSDFGHGFMGMATEVENAIPAFEAIDLSFDEFITIMSRSRDDVTDFTNLLRRLAQEAEKAGDMDLADNYRDAADALDQMAKNTEAATKGQEAFNEWAAGSDAVATSFDEINTAMVENQRHAAELAANWSILVKAQQAGQLDMPAAVAAWNNLAAATELENDEIAELLDQKVAEEMEAEAQALADAEAAAREFAAAIADATEAIGQIDADDVANIGAALQSAFDLGDVTVDFQTTKENLRDGFAELATFLEENPVDIDWSKVLDTTQDTGLSSELLGMIAGIRDQFQEGITSAFEIAGPSAAQHFANTFLPQLRLMGMTQAQAMEFLGLPPNGNVDVIIQPLIDAEAKADALANLGSLAGVDPNNPIIAYVTAALQTGSMDPVIGEIISLLIAQEYGIPVEPQLAEFAPDQIADAQAQLASVGEEPVTVSMTVDDGGTVDDFTTAADTAAEERNPQFVVPKSDSLGQMETLLNAVARNRIVQFIAKADNAGKIDSILNHVARFREQHTYATVDARNAFHTLDLLDNPRTVHINVQTHGVAAAAGAVGSIPGVNTAAAAPMATTVAAPTAPAAATYSSGGGGAVTVLAAPAPVTNNVTIQAGVIGNRFEVQRAVSRALRQSQRLNGRRN